MDRESKLALVAELMDEWFRNENTAYMYECRRKDNLTLELCNKLKRYKERIMELEEQNRELNQTMEDAMDELELSMRRIQVLEGAILDCPNHACRHIRRIRRRISFSSGSDTEYERVNM
jgi:hypothetical protein